MKCLSGSNNISEAPNGINYGVVISILSSNGYSTVERQYVNSPFDLWSDNLLNLYHFDKKK